VFRRAFGHDSGTEPELTPNYWPVSDVPGTQDAQWGEDLIAYQVFGDGDVDLLWVAPSGDCIDLRWDWAPYANFFMWLGKRARPMSFDRPGTGASDMPLGLYKPSME
jgi:hypothetical protein